MRKSFLGVGILTMFMVLLIGMSDGASGQILPTFTWNFAGSEVKYVDVGPGSTGSTLFSGSIEINTGTQPEVQCFFEVQAAGLGATVSPSSVVVPAPESTETKPVGIVVIMPIGTPMGPRPVIVSGRWQSGAGLAGTIGSQQLVAYANPYYMMDVSSTNPTVEVNPADSISFNLKIANQANTEDRFKLTVSNSKSLDDDGWSIPTIGTVTLQSKEEKTIQVRVETPQDWTMWKNEIQGINVLVTSEYSQQNEGDIPVTYEYTLYCRQKGFYLPAYDPFIMISGLAVAMVIFAGRRATG